MIYYEMFHVKHLKAKYFYYNIDPVTLMVKTFQIIDRWKKKKSHPSDC